MALYDIPSARQDVTAQQVTGLMNTYKTVIEENGGKIGKTEYWGLKSTAYKIKKNRRAHYAFFNIEAPHQAVLEMERQMRISTDILRFLTVRVDELDEKPSIQMRKQDDRDRDRGDRGDRGDVALDRLAVTAMTVALAAVADSAMVAVVVVKAAASAHHAPQEVKNEHARSQRRSAPPLLSPPQDLPLHGRQCAGHRLQGRPALTALHFRAR